jgi:hypothetical protein
MIDNALRPLRPIGVSTSEVVARTGRVLARLTDRPGVQLVSNMPVAGTPAPVTHALSAGRLILFVESVAWPAGTYSTTADGGVLCDGVYIGQSVLPLLDAVRQARRTLPDDYQIGGVVVVHPSLPAAPTLPATGPVELSWIPPARLASRMQRRLRRALCRPRAAPR